MVLELARIAVTPGSEEAFVRAFHSVREVLVTTPGCRSARMTRGIESPSLFVLLVEWDSVEAHERTSGAATGSASGVGRWARTSPGRRTSNTSPTSLTPGGLK